MMSFLKPQSFLKISRAFFECKFERKNPRNERKYPQTSANFKKRQGPKKWNVIRWLWLASFGGSSSANTFGWLNMLASNGSCSSLKEGATYLDQNCTSPQMDSTEDLDAMIRVTFLHHHNEFSEFKLKHCLHDTCYCFVCTPWTPLRQQKPGSLSWTRSWTQRQREAWMMCPRIPKVQGYNETTVFNYEVAICYNMILETPIFYEFNLNPYCILFQRDMIIWVNPGSDGQIYFAKSDGRFNADPPVRRLESAFLTPPTKLARTCSRPTLTYEANGASGKNQDVSHARATAGDGRGSAHDKPAKEPEIEMELETIPGKSPAPERHGSAGSGKPAGKSAQKYDKYYHRRGICLRRILFSILFIKNHFTYNQNSHEVQSSVANVKYHLLPQVVSLLQAPSRWNQTLFPRSFQHVENTRGT